MRIRMRGLFSTLFLLLLAVMMITTEAGKNKKDKGKGQAGSDCEEWRFGNCKANNGNCGTGVREGTCKGQTRKLKCKVPCNWKKNFGADCKYKFDNWGECDTSTSTKTRSGTLVKNLFHAECQPNILVSKSCAPKTPKGNKGKGRGN